MYGTTKLGQLEAYQLTIDSSPEPPRRSLPPCSKGLHGTEQIHSEIAASSHSQFFCVNLMAGRRGNEGKGGLLMVDTHSYHRQSNGRSLKFPQEKGRKISRNLLSFCHKSHYSESQRHASILATMIKYCKHILKWPQNCSVIDTAHFLHWISII